MSIKSELLYMAEWPLQAGHQVLLTIREQNSKEAYWVHPEKFEGETRRVAEELKRNYTPIPLLNRGSPVITLLITGGAYLGALYLSQGFGPETRVITSALLYGFGMLSNQRFIRVMGGGITRGGYHQAQMLIAGAIAGTTTPLL